VEHQLGLLSRAELRDRIDAGAVVLVPVGSLEQHGDHLPVTTDTMIATHVCLSVAAAAEPDRDLIVAPALWTGFSPHHVRFGATVSLSAETFIRLVSEVVRGMRAWAPRLLLVNGHGGNRGPLITVALETECPLVSYWEFASDRVASLFPADASIGHAGGAETAMMRSAYPESVGTPSPAFERPPDAELLLPDMGASGVLGDPMSGSADAGSEFLDAVVTAFVARLDVLVPSGPKEFQ
jgi:creatinine amidohydrolase